MYLNQKICIDISAVKPPGKAGNSSLGYTNTKCKKGKHVFILSLGYFIKQYFSYQQTLDYSTIHFFVTTGYHCRYPIQSTKKLAERSVNTSSRIINAKPQKHHIYPWMAQVQVTVAFDLNYPPSDTGSPAAITGSGGSIISNHVILTAGHSLCVDEYHTYFDGKSRFQITCPLSAGEADDNLNRVDVNEINFLVGDNHHRIIDPTYNPNVEAFLYEYEKERYAFSANGDVGILVIKGGLGIDGHSIQGSCLPEPDQFQEELTVKHVGWGLRFDQLIVNGQVTKTSCHTNEGTTSGDIHNSLSSERRVQFLDCKISNSGEKFCNDWLLRKGVETLSAITDVSEITGNSDDELHFNLKKREEQKICEDYLKKAKKAWHDDGRSETEFYERIDRIIIRKFGENQIRPENICYNLQKVAAYGFCVTEKSTPRNWGFCSRSCEYFPVDANTVLGINKPYEEGYYRYFETNPYPRDVFKGMCSTINVNMFNKVEIRCNLLLITLFNAFQIIIPRNCNQCSNALQRSFLGLRMLYFRKAISAAIWSGKLKLMMLNVLKVSMVICSLEQEILEDHFGSKIEDRFSLWRFIAE